MPTVPRRFTCPETTGAESGAGEGANPSCPAAGVVTSIAPAPSRRREASRRRIREPRDGEDLRRDIGRRVIVRFASLPAVHRCGKTHAGSPQAFRGRRRTGRFMRRIEVRRGGGGRCTTRTCLFGVARPESLTRSTWTGGSVCPQSFSSAQVGQNAPSND